MSGTIIRIDELDSAIRKEIEAMNREVIDKANKAAEKAANQGAKELKATSPVRHDGYKRRYPPGSYAKSWGVVKEGNVLGVTQYTIRNAKHYSLTHLLEFGHIDAKTGRRTKAYPHIAAVNKSASEAFVKEVEGMKL